MSYKLSELQDIAEKKGPEYFIGQDRMVCLHSTMYAVNDALMEADEIDYVHPEVVKASSGLVAGLWTSEGTCGIVTAAGILISLKYGTSDPRDRGGRYATGVKTREFYHWFKKEFGSCRCSDISLVDDWGDIKQGEWYNENRREHCGEILGKTTRKIVDILTVDNPNVLRDV
jgi:C_GCAxxG_C_C family probable redox protein